MTPTLHPHKKLRATSAEAVQATLEGLFEEGRAVFWLVHPEQGPLHDAVVEQMATISPGAKKSVLDFRGELFESPDSFVIACNRRISGDERHSGNLNVFFDLIHETEYWDFDARTYWFWTHCEVMLMQDPTLFGDHFAAFLDGADFRARAERGTRKAAAPANVRSMLFTGDFDTFRPIFLSGKNPFYPVQEPLHHNFDWSAGHLQPLEVVPSDPRASL